MINWRVPAAVRVIDVHTLGLCRILKRTLLVLQKELDMHRLGKEAPGCHGTRQASCMLTSKIPF